jgi:hypothetical protein
LNDWNFWNVWNGWNRAFPCAPLNVEL